MLNVSYCNQSACSCRLLVSAKEWGSLLKAAGRTASVTFNVVNITDGMAWHGMYAAFSGYYKVHLEACKSNFMYFT